MSDDLDSFTRASSLTKCPTFSFHVTFRRSLPAQLDIQQVAYILPEYQGLPSPLPDCDDVSFLPSRGQRPQLHRLSVTLSHLLPENRKASHPLSECQEAASHLCEYSEALTATLGCQGCENPHLTARKSPSPRLRRPSSPFWNVVSLHLLYLSTTRSPLLYISVQSSPLNPLTV